MGREGPNQRVITKKGAKLHSWQLGIGWWRAATPRAEHREGGIRHQINTKRISPSQPQS